MKNLNTIDAVTLMDTPLEKPKFIIDKLLPQGLHIFAGSPKIGKSWLVLWLAIQISKGEPVWGYKTNPCDVLYLGLEDGLARIQDRIFKITEDVTDGLIFATETENLDNQFEDQIIDFLNVRKDLKVIIIDTFQKIRGTGANTYAVDYEKMTRLKKLADDNGLAIILVHHLRKYKKADQKDDPLNLITGSIGISASVDTNFVLMKNNRRENYAKLHCIGRDIEQRELNLEFSKSSFTWESSDIIESDDEFIDDTILSIIKYIHKVKEFVGTASNLNEIIHEKTPAVLKKKIVKYISILNDNGIRYEDLRTSQQRNFKLVYDGVTPMKEYSNIEIVPSSLITVL
ncbi:MAG: AAA family ATPase [Clostridia bacterium]